jgi:hypothetical protein
MKWLSPEKVIAYNFETELKDLRIAFIVGASHYSLLVG